MGIVGMFRMARRDSRVRVLRGFGVAVAVVVGVLAVGVASALAVGPEEPSAVSVGLISPVSVSFAGSVNPVMAPEPPVGGQYWFAYRAHSAECKGGSQTAPKPYEGILPSEPAEELDVTGLSEATEYSVCLVVESEGHKAEGPVLTFTTPEAVEGPLTKPAVVLSSSSAMLSGVLRPAAKSKGEADRYAFRYAASPSSCEGGETGEQTATGEPEQEVSTELTGLSPTTVYTACLVARNDALAGPEGTLGVAGSTVTFKTPVAVPTVTGTTTTSVLAREATVAAGIDPGGEATSYYLQYTTEASYQAKGWEGATRIPSSGVETLPAEVSPIPVHTTIIGLAPNTAYRVEYVATNEEGGKSKGSEAETTFTTQSAASTSPALPDGRAYELVSTPGSGEPYLPQTPAWQPETQQGQYATMAFQAATNGERVAYVAEAGEAGGIGLPTIGDQWLATRTATGWQPENITPFLLNEGPAGEPVFQAFSPDLTGGIFEEPITQVPLVSGVFNGCRTLDTSNGFSGQKSLTALFTTGVTTGNVCGNPLFAGETTGGTDIIFQSEAALTPGSQEATEPPVGHYQHEAEESIGKGCAFGCNLYEASGGQLRLVSEIEENGAMVPVPNATLGGYGGHTNRGLPNFSHAISSDGSRVFWTDTEPESFEGPPVEEVYVLENGTREVKISGPHSQYWTATPDGHFAYYVEDEEGPERTGRLYRFNTETNKSEELTPAGAGVISMIGTNTTGDDGEYVYFVAKDENDALEPGAGELGEPKVYVMHGGVTSLVATDSVYDNFIRVARRGTVTNVSPWIPNLGFRQMTVSPDGTHLVFQTTSKLTEFNNQEAVEVYVYSAVGGGLVCVSCDAAGVPPGGEEERSGKLTVSAESYVYEHRWMSANGNRVFFSTSQSLVPGDVNGVMDVYEWEREGEGTCPVRVPASAVGGCQFLLSGGQSEAASFFVDADESGNNVFFAHVGVLGAVQIPSGHVEIYDARVGGGFPSSTAGCSGAGCAGTPPVVSSGPSGFAPESAGDTGVGNYPPAVAKPPVTRAQRLAKALVVCRRDRVKRKRAACERLARKRYGPLKKAKAKGGKAAKAKGGAARASGVLVSSGRGVR
jgi:hypothetical protein